MTRLRTDQACLDAQLDRDAWLREALDKRGIGVFTTEPDRYGDYLIVRHGAFYARISGKELAARSLSPGTISCQQCKSFWTEDGHQNRCKRPKTENGFSWVETVCLSCWQSGEPRRDTERCPPPSEGGFKRDLHAMIEAGLAQESLTRAAAREFYESMGAIADQAMRDMPKPPPIKWLESPPWTGEGSSVRCSICGAEPGAKCRTPMTGPLSHAHWLRAQAEQRAKTPTAPDCAPAIAPEAVASTPARPVCACGQTIWAGSLDGPSPSMCADCEQEAARTGGTWPSPLDDRIKAASTEAKSDDATECAWSTPTSEGEGWTFSSSNKETRK